MGFARVEALRHGGAAAPAFDPSSLSDLNFWHDGALSSKTTSGSNYTQWNDLSGNTRHWAQATTALAPHTGRTINSIVAMDFDGTEFMTIAGGDGILATGHIFMVLVIDTNQASRYIYEAGGILPASGFYLRQAASLRMEMQLSPDGVASDSLTSAGGNVFVVGTPFLLEMRFAGTGTMGLRVAGNTETTATAVNGGAGASPAPGLFGNTDGTSLSDGAIAFSCGYSSVKSGADLTNLRSYINTRFGT